MENGDRIRRRPKRNRHVAKLGQSRVGNNTLDVILDNAQDAQEQCPDRANHNNERQGGIGKFEYRRKACHHENAGRHHGCRMNQCRNGRGAFHGVGQPGVQGNLGRFPHGADKQANARNRNQRPIGARERRTGQCTRLGKHLVIIHTARIREQQANPEYETEVTHTVYEKRLHIGENGGWPGIPETNQQVRHQAHGFPAEKQLQHVVRHDQHEHRKGEQRNVGEKALIAGIVHHIANGVDMHHQ